MQITRIFIAPLLLLVCLLLSACAHPDYDTHKEGRVTIIDGPVIKR